MTRLLCIALLFASFAQNALAQTATIQGTVTQQGSSNPIIGAQVRLSIPAVFDATESIVNMATTMGIPPSALEGVRESLAAMLQASPAALQQQIDEARRDGAPPEYLAILNQVLASRIGSPGFPKNAVTDNAGRFTFTNVPPGNYLLSATREGLFGISAVGTNARSKVASIPVTVTDRQATLDLSVSMIPGGVIQGRVRGSSGGSVPKASVYAMSPAYQNGALSLHVVARKDTDDRGEFRLFWLEPGDYFVVATPPPGSSIQEILAQTFYPNSLRYADAMAVTVGAGQEVTGTDITVRSAPVFRIEGQAVGLPSIDAARARGSTTTILLIDRNNPISESGSTGPVRSEVNLVHPVTGGFVMSQVPPGSYDLLASVLIPGVARDPGTTLTGHATVELRDRDIQGLTIAMKPDFEVRGKVTVPGNTMAAVGASFHVALQPDGISALAEMDGGDPAPAGPDGSFSFSGISAGDYRVRVFGMPPGGYVQDVREPERSIYNSGLRIRDSAPQPLEVTVRLDGGTVEGVAVTPDQKVSPTTVVVLVPTPPIERQNGERYKIITSDPQGRFKITGVAPGQYKAFAWRNLPLGAYQNPAFLARYESQGATVNVTASSTNNVRVVVIQN